MQRVAACILERTEDLQRPAARKAEGGHLRAVIEAWLKSKGASSVDGTGTYAAVDCSDASYQVTTIVDGERSWRMFELSEVTPERIRPCRHAAPGALSLAWKFRMRTNSVNVGACGAHAAATRRLGHHAPPALGAGGRPAMRLAVTVPCIPRNTAVSPGAA